MPIVLIFKKYLFMFIETINVIFEQYNFKIYYLSHLFNSIMNTTFGKCYDEPIK